MAKIERNGDGAVIYLNTSELEFLINALESAGNSAARYRHNFPEDSLRYKFELDKAYAVWLWSNGLGACPPNSSNEFEVKVDL